MTAPHRATLDGRPLNFNTGTHIVDRNNYWLETERPPPPTTFTKLLNWFTPDRTRPGESKPLGRYLHDLYYSRLYIPEDHSWEGERPLGAGAFGMVALFKKNNQLGEAVDRMVVKVAEAQPWRALPERLDIPTEAEIMRQLNWNPENESILMLRGFRSLTREHQWRFYLEHCPYGDLERLRRRYEAWGHYLPELFLWNIFLWLVSAADAMAEDDFVMYSGYRAGREYPETYVLHRDIKDQNVFLGYETSHEPARLQDYPMPKLADFGLAEIVHPVDLSSRWEYNLDGTPMWHPPEVRKEYFPSPPGRTWYPFAGRVHDDAKEVLPDGRIKAPTEHHIGPEANLFPIGMIMYCLMTLEEPHDVDDRIENVLKYQNPLPGNHIFPAIRTKQNAEDEYSADLRSMVRDCLCLVPLDRPTAITLIPLIVERVKALQDKLLNEHGGEGVRKRTKVYFRENEINDLPPGPYREDMPDWWWEDFDRDEMFEDPAWGRLYPPGHPTRNAEKALEDRWGSQVGVFRDMPLDGYWLRGSTRSAPDLEATSGDLEGPPYGRSG